jgi:Holliday junction DNA helicase RuvB
VAGHSSISGAAAVEALERLEVDRLGLDEIDRRILATLVRVFDGGPTGVSTLAAAVGEDPETLEEIYEPYLLQIGFLDRTPRGRRLTRLGREYVKDLAPGNRSLF